MIYLLALLTPDVFIKESKHIVLPLRHRKVKEVVAVLCGFADGWINFQNMRLVQACEFIGQRLTGRSAVIIRGLNQHDRGCCLIDRSYKSLA